MNLQQLKSIFLKAMLGCLVAAAGVAVTTVLIGHFNDVSEKALFTILLIAIHCLISFGFIVNNEKQDTFDNLSFFSNATFLIIVLSFITSVAGVWGALPGELVARLYGAYVVLLFAILHGEILSKALRKQRNIDTIVKINFIFMLIVVVMLMPVIFLQDNQVLGSVFYRVLAASGIIDATLTLIAIILHKLYIQKHPVLKDPVFNMPGLTAGQQQVLAASRPKRGMNIFVIILVVYVGLQLVGMLLLFAFSALFR